MDVERRRAHQDRAQAQQALVSGAWPLLLSIEQACAYLGVSPVTFRKICPVPAVALSAAVIVVPADYYSRSLFYEDVVRGALEEATDNSLKVDVRLVPLDPTAAVGEIGEMLDLANHGAIVAMGMDHPRVIDRIVESRLPAVDINGMDRTMRLSCVLPDNWAAGWLATQCLLRAGHREIVHVTLPHRLSLQRRLEGFRVALEEDGIDFDRNRHVLDLGRLGPQEPDAQQGLRQAFQDGKFDYATAFFCSTDVVALGVMQALQSRKFTVPRDFSVIGLDDVAIALHSSPPLTTVRIDRMELGRVGMRVLLDRIADPDTSVRRVNLGVTLIERSTVGPPRPD